ncbi:putative transcriptional regulatory protein C3H8.08c like [Verticillium longisporum]|uniref:Putative transcriptional regulatory protein C3H8.08c like n=1 Tax=Verticillium longisporum TaxID=100787 RepID=A0A8I3A0Z2_VERLO|nr:putative transcriptional regulatory protein C3H8.08c like [Verticillium longisporum]
MEADELTDGESSRRPRKKRIPKACGACRQSKVKCDGQRPCSRCHSLRKVCTFTERPKDANEMGISE